MADQSSKSKYVDKWYP